MATYTLYIVYFYIIQNNYSPFFPTYKPTYLEQICQNWIYRGQMQQDTTQPVTKPETPQQCILLGMLACSTEFHSNQFILVF